MSKLQVVPELICRDVEVTKRFYVDVFGFTIKYERPSELFVYFTLDGVDVMVEGIDTTSRQWLLAELDPPFGRGVNLQWSVADLDEIYSRVKQQAPTSI